MNIHHETWEISPGTGWHLIPYQPGKRATVTWFTPRPPAQTPAGCAVDRATSLSIDRLGRSWWTWDGNVYDGVAGLCLPVFKPDESQPFIDGRLLQRVLVDSRGNVFLETLIANHRVGEYVIYSPPGPPPLMTLRVTRTSPASIRLDFSSASAGKILYTFRVDSGNWSTPQPQDFAVLQALPGGEHRLEAAAIDSRLRMDPLPAFATVDINVNPQKQITDLIRQLANATSDDEREVAIEAIERQPAAAALPALRAAKARANDTEAWWISAAIQAVTQRSNP